MERSGGSISTYFTDTSCRAEAGTGATALNGEDLELLVYVRYPAASKRHGEGLLLL